MSRLQDPKKRPDSDRSGDQFDAKSQCRWIQRAITSKFSLDLADGRRDDGLAPFRAPSIDDSFVVT
jgi:hypothetical protein